MLLRNSDDALDLCREGQATTNVVHFSLMQKLPISACTAYCIDVLEILCKNICVLSGVLVSGHACSQSYQAP